MIGPTPASLSFPSNKRIIETCCMFLYRTVISSSPPRVPRLSFRFQINILVSDVPKFFVCFLARVQELSVVVLQERYLESFDFLLIDE